MKDYKLKTHKLEDSIVLDGIESINFLKNEKKIKGCISGGMAVSSYLPFEEHRETVDLDYNLFFKSGTKEYKKMSEPLISFLSEKGYNVKYKKRSSTHDLLIEKENDSLLIQHQRRSLNNFLKNKKSLEREMDNSRVISRKDTSYSVLSPEDLVIRKINRSLKFKESYGLTFPKNINQENFKKKIDLLRDETLFLLDNILPEDIAKLRLYYDIFDIKSLGKNVGLNKNYFEEVLKDWASSESSKKNFKKVMDFYNIMLD